MGQRDGSFVPKVKNGAKVGQKNRPFVPKFRGDDETCVYYHVDVGGGIAY